MMKDVCFYRQAKKLVELGVNIRTKKYWNLYHSADTYFLSTTPNNDGEYYPAPNFDELAEILNHCAPDVGIYTDKMEDGYLLWVEQLHNGMQGFFKTEAGALCGALIWLIEEGHLNASELEL